MTKRIGFDLKAQPTWLHLKPTGVVHPTRQAPGARAGGLSAKAREVVLANERVGPNPHRGEIERDADMPARSSAQWIDSERRLKVIAIPSGKSTSSCVKALRGDTLLDRPRT